MVEEDKESAATGSLGLVDARRMELSIRVPQYLGTVPLKVPAVPLEDGTQAGGNRRVHAKETRQLYRI